MVCPASFSASRHGCQPSKVKEKLSRRSACPITAGQAVDLPTGDLFQGSQNDAADFELESVDASHHLLEI
jgi:hypothetical protein